MSNNGMVNNVTEQAKKIQNEVRDGAYKAWLAGLGTVALVETEGKSLVDDGKKMFTDLVERGRKFEDRSKKEMDKATQEAKKEVRTVKGRVEQGVDELTEQVDKRIATTLHRMGIPTRNEIHNLTARVEELTARLEGQMTAMEKQATVEKKAAKTKVPARLVYHVATHEDGWKVERQGTDKPLSTHATKDLAIDAAREIAQATEPSQVVVHRMDGTIQTNYTYDPAADA